MLRAMSRCGRHPLRLADAPDGSEARLRMSSVRWFMILASRGTVVVPADAKLIDGHRGCGLEKWQAVARRRSASKTSRNVVPMFGCCEARFA